jgi:hypothetical protein
MTSFYFKLKAFLRSRKKGNRKDVNQSLENINWKSITDDDVKLFMQKSEVIMRFMVLIKNSFVNFDIGIDGEKVGSLVVELFIKTCPITCQNFINLTKNGYKKTIFHRLVQNGWIQGGDTDGLQGKGGKSSFNEDLFPGNL